MKNIKWITLVLMIVLALTLAACGGGDAPEEPAAPEPAATEAPAPVEEEPAEEPAEEAAEMTCDDPLGCISVAADDPIRIGYALVISGANETLGIDSRNGIEIAIDDKGEVLGHAIELVGEDALCSAEGGQAAATKLASDPTLIGVIGTNCSSGGEPASAILSDAGTSLVSPSNTAPSLTAPETHQAWLPAHCPQRQGAG